MTPAQDDWQGANWEDAELNTLRAGAALTFREKLHWLEGLKNWATACSPAGCVIRTPSTAAPGL
jgi:hypothetical protein